MHGKVISLSCHAIVIFEQLIFSSMAHFPANVFYEITGITDALKKNAHDQNEQTILYNICSINNATIFHQFGFTLLCFVQMFFRLFKHTAVKIL